MDYAQLKHVEFRRKFLKLFGAEISVFEPASNQLVGYIHMKAWKLREDIRFYRDKAQTQELFAIHARNIIDFSATYDVIDSASNQVLFSFRRHGLKSTFVRDHWDLLDTAGNVIGGIQETSSGLALVRRWLGAISDLAELILMFVAQTYDISINTQQGGSAQIGHVVHRKNPLAVKMGVDTSMAQVAVDPRVVLAAVSLLSIIDATKN